MQSCICALLPKRPQCVLRLKGFLLVAARFVQHAAMCKDVSHVQNTILQATERLDCDVDASLQRTQ